jgi:hypothetical protein
VRRPEFFGDVHQEHDHLELPEARRGAGQRFGEVEEARACRQQAELRAGERELVDPGELVAEEPLAARVSAIVEAVGGREHQAQLVHRRFQVLGRYEARKDHEAVFVPGLCRLCEVHRSTIAGVTAAVNPFSRSG